MYFLLCTALFNDLFCSFQCSSDIRAEILFTCKSNKSSLFHYLHRLLIYMGEYNGHALAFAGLCKCSQGIHCCAVQCRNGSHTQYQALCALFHYNVLNGIRSAKEQRAAYFVNTDLSRKLAQVSLTATVSSSVYTQLSAFVSSLIL